MYLAERTDIGGEVAIKLLRDAWVSPARRMRFSAEQRMLAQLKHPGIAQIFEADTLRDGIPWFAMEYVDGWTLLDYWAQHPGTVQDCLILFREICEIVSYAHRRTIIHRDLKPTNIMVTPERRVKLLDFGVAKSLDETANKGALTIDGLRPMTPAYAPPEQQNGGPVGVFTDIYALGVLLYELLTGVLPFDEKARALAIRPEPRRPSIVAHAERFTQPIRRSAWADLNMLCLTAMHPEPDHRYQSTEAMIRDIDAFLEERPLAARPDGWSYRLRKFVVRRSVPLTYAAATILLAVGLIGYFTFRLREARDAAVAEAARTERIQSFTSNLFRGNESSVGPAEDMRVKTLLDRGREEVESLSGDPEMQADMRETLGDIYRKLGDTQQAGSLIASSLEYRRTQRQDQPRKYAHGLIELGLVRMDEGKLDEAEQMTREALAISRTLPKEVEHGARPLTVEAPIALGTVLEAKGSYSEAEQLLSHALQLRPAQGVPDADIAANLRELANVHFYQGHYTVADSLNRQVLAMHQALYGEHHPEIAEDLNNLAAIQLELGNLDQAESKYRQALAITEAWYGPQHPKTAEDLTSLGRTLIRAKRLQDARAVLERALNIQQQVHGHDHLAVASALNELGSIESMQEAYDDAENHYSEALEIWRKIYGRSHQFIGVGLSNLGSVYMGKKDYSRAEVMYRQALAVFQETVHEDHLNTGIAHIKLGRALLRQRRYLDAETETRRGYETLANLVAPSNGFLKAATVDLVQIYVNLNRSADAEYFRGR
ncbi:MAG TPA: serine/threonine-protein kinase [Edaphobacter sp.]